MASNIANRIQLKRSDTESRVPDVGSLSLGELAVNTFDGKLFFKKNNGSDSLESIVTTNAQITGSVELTGAVTSSLTLVSNQSPTENVFTIKIGGTDKVYVDKDGVFNVDRISVRDGGDLKVPSKATLSDGVQGDTAVSGSNFFIYL